MKMVELLNNIQVPLTNEEWEVLEKFNDSRIRLKEELDEREQLLANSLVKKSILRRKKDAAGKLCFIKNIR